MNFAVRPFPATGLTTNAHRVSFLVFFMTGEESNIIPGLSIVLVTGNPHGLNIYGKQMKRDSDFNVLLGKISRKNICSQVMDSYIQ
jgi:hypothetical protein